jgi:hypothetical protein
MLASRGKVAIPIAMSVPDQMPLAEVKNRRSEVVDRLEREHGAAIRTGPAHASSRLWESPDELLDRFHLEVVPSPSGVTHYLFWRR